MTDDSPFEFSGTERFEVLSKLGSGGMGVVYAVHDREQDTRVALKTLVRPNPSTLYRLKNEFRALQDMHHPNLVSMGELFKEGGQWFFTMELIDGFDFVTYIRGSAGQEVSDLSEPGRSSSLGADEPTLSDELPITMPTEDAKDDLDLETRQVRAEQISRECAGHPLFIQQMAHHILEKQDPAEVLRLDEVLFARIAALESRARTLVELISVAGGPIQQDTAAETIGLEPAELTRLVARLKVANILRSRGMRLDDTIEPYHDRVRDTVLVRLSPEDHRSWHGKLSRALQATGRAEPELLARHCEGAGELASAARYAAQAAAQAAETLAFGRAARLYRKALELWPESTDAEAHNKDRRSLWSNLGDALANAGRGGEAAEAYLQAIPGAKAAEALELKRRAAEQLLSSGHVDQGIELTGQVLSVLGMKLPRTPLGSLWSLLLRRLHIRLRGVGFKERDESQVSDEALVRVDTCYSVGIGLGVADHFRGADFSTRYVLSALQAGEPERVLMALLMEVTYISAAARSGSRYHRKLISTAEGLLSRKENLLAVAWLEGAQAYGAFMAGAWNEAKDHAERSIELAQKHGGAWWELAAMRLVILWSLFYLGELEELARRAGPLVQEALDRGDLFAASGMIVGRPNVIFLQQGDPTRARQEVTEMIERWSVKGYHLQHYYALLANAHIDLYLGEGLQAHRRVSEEWSLLKRSLLLLLSSVKFEALHLRGRVALAAAREAEPSQRKRLLSQARKEARRLTRRKLPWTSALAELLRAGVSVQRGKRTAGVASLETAIDLFDGADMGLYAAAARRRLGQLVGGDEGAAHLAASDEFMARQKIKDPERMTAMLVPGVGESED